MKRRNFLIMLMVLLSNFYAVQAQAAPIITPQVVGGQPSSRDQWPWIMALVANDSGSLFNRQFCGGSLIAPNWVVTAAHCVSNANGKVTQAKTINVVAGLLDLGTDSGQEIHVKRIIRHPAYNRHTVKNDIALIQLQAPVTYPNTAVLSLNADTISTLEGVDASIIGWGALSEADSNNGIYPTMLYDTKLPVISNDTCKQSYPTDHIAKTQLCAGLPQGGKDTCQGDSGGPLVVWQNTQWVLAGITSYGKGCAEPDYYGVYTRVSSYVKFIKSKLKSNYSPRIDPSSPVRPFERQ